MCSFCAIVGDPSQAHVVLDRGGSLAFLDHRPLFAGHTLLIPKEHFETLGDLPTDRIEEFFGHAQMLAAGIESAMGAQGTFVAMNNKVSQSVPHLHVHVVPRRRKDGLRGFFWPRTKYRGDHHMAETASTIRAELERLSADHKQ
ncbi:MAG TPA: HIT family protein [Actinomycetota bacterium]|nr:HIT family protein [Actinomycetota bacterium]